MKLKVMLHRAARISSFLIFARRNGRSSIPKCCKDRNGGEYSEKETCEQSAIDLASQIDRNYAEKSPKEEV